MNRRRTKRSETTLDRSGCHAKADSEETPSFEKSAFRPMLSICLILNRAFLHNH